ncbi:tyrosine-type recombinase/integrase [Corynebacterium glyciniphilum]|uniref:tyrosine-type recombinase/integrase n=1 Tax=Corynebacterium glyciniphilum TaxID=1404244 RepID=UPI001642BD36|nr:tyrosine-type recombinase/integrase [Corynebacterium glyciniphilum]
MKASTVDSHRRRLELRVLCTSLADEPVVGVDRARIALWWAEVQQRWPDTGNTNSFAYKRLRTAFQHAVDEMEVITTNPVRIKGAGTPPRSGIRDRPVITVSEARDLVDGVSDRMKAPVEVLLYAGLRLGELLALRRKDVLGLNGDGAVTLRVRRDAERVTEHYEDPTTGKPKRRQIMQEFDTPKTNAANRDVTLPEPVGNSLRKHCREYVKPGADALIVTTSTSARMMDTSFRSRLTPGKKRAGRNDVGPHDFRRYYGTMLVTNGVDLESARRLMGHETVQQLMEYMRAASGYERSAADVLARVMKQGADEDQGGDKEQPGAPGNTEKGNPDNE